MARGVIIFNPTLTVGTNELTLKYQLQIFFAFLFLSVLSDLFDQATNWPNN